MNLSTEQFEAIYRKVSKKEPFNKAGYVLRDFVEEFVKEIPNSQLSREETDKMGKVIVNK